MPVFKKRVLLETYKGVFRGHFSNSYFTKCRPECSHKILDWSKIGCKTVRNSLFRSVFSSKGQISIRVGLCFENFWSHMSNTSIQVPPPASNIPNIGCLIHYDTIKEVGNCNVYSLNLLRFFGIGCFMWCLCLSLCNLSIEGVNWQYLVVGSGFNLY